MNKIEEDLKHTNFQLDALEIQKKRLFASVKEMRGLTINKKVSETILAGFEIAYEMGAVYNKYSNILKLIEARKA